MSVSLSLFAGVGQQFFDNSGIPLAGGLIYTYEAGTSTPATTYTSASGVTPQTNPIVLDAAGRVPSGEIWLTSGLNYKFVLKTSVGITIATYDNVPSSLILSDTISAIETILATSTGSSLVGNTASGTGAIATTVQSKLRESVSVKDFGAVGNGTTDDTTAFTNALNSGALKIIAPSGSYLIDTISIPSKVTLDLTGATLLFKAHTTSHNPMIRIGTLANSVSNAKILNGTLIGNSASQTYSAEEWSPGIFIWGANYNSVIGTTITDCKGDGITIGYDTGRVVGANANTVKDCLIYGNLAIRQAISITYGNENLITSNRCSGTIDLEINASTGECKNNIVTNNTGIVQAENLAIPRISSLVIFVGTLNTNLTLTQGNIISNNNCASISLQYTSNTLVIGNTIIGSLASQVRLIDLSGAPNTSIAVSYTHLTLPTNREV